MLYMICDTLYTVDKIKTPVIVKIAMQCSDLYSEALSNMMVGSVRGQWEKGWLAIVSGKSQYFHGVAQHHLGLVAQGNKCFGEAVARMKVGKSLCACMCMYVHVIMCIFICTM